MYYRKIENKCLKNLLIFVGGSEVTNRFLGISQYNVTRLIHDTVLLYSCANKMATLTRPILIKNKIIEKIGEKYNQCQQENLRLVFRFYKSHPRQSLG